MTALDDTSNCPLGPRCEACGLETPDVRVVIATTELGTMCLTECPRCARGTTAPPVSVGTAARLSLQHCLHLGITVDDMVAIRPDCPACTSRNVANLGNGYFECFACGHGWAPVRT